MTENKIIEQNNPDYWVFENNNMFSKNKLTYENAEKLNKTLINCYNCTDCNDCENCINCINCSNCINCIGCEDCEDCENCIHCRNCYKCSMCIETFHRDYSNNLC